MIPSSQRVYCRTFISVFTSKKSVETAPETPELQSETKLHVFYGSHCIFSHTSDKSTAVIKDTQEILLFTQSPSIETSVLLNHTWPSISMQKEKNCRVGG